MTIQAAGTLPAASRLIAVQRADGLVIALSRLPGLTVGKSGAPGLDEMSFPLYGAEVRVLEGAGELCRAIIGSFVPRSFHVCFTF